MGAEIANLQDTAGSKKLDHGASGIAVYKNAKGEALARRHEALKLLALTQEGSRPQHKLLTPDLISCVRPERSKIGGT